LLLLLLGARWPVTTCEVRLQTQQHIQHRA
jgi:hypothetical protein